MRGIYEHDVEKIRRLHGDFILVNTNFNQVNAYYPDMNLFKPAEGPNMTPQLSRRAIGMGMSREYAEGLTNLKQAIFEDFQRLVPALDQTLPDHTIVIRPHPAENQTVYHNIAKTCRRVRVTNEGNVVPWLIAAKALIHNGCTTGVEAFALGLPAISYRASINEYYDNAFHRLPNQLSHECFDLEQLQRTLENILTGQLAQANSDERKKVMENHLAAMSGPLACDRMVDVFEELFRTQQTAAAAPFISRLKSRIWANRRRIKKRFKGFKADMSHNKAEYLRHRYPAVSKEDLQSRLAQFQEILGDRMALKVEQIFNQFYRISDS
jgi:hypothetical protein